MSIQIYCLIVIALLVLRFTSGATPADLVVATMATDLFSSMYSEQALGDTNLDLYWDCTANHTYEKYFFEGKLN